MISKNQAKQIVDDLRQQRKLQTDEILKHLEKAHIAKSSDVLKIIDAMLSYGDYFIYFIVNNLSVYSAPNNQFVRIIRKLSKLKQFENGIYNLRTLYRRDPKSADFIYEKLQKIDEYEIALVTGSVLGGKGQINPDFLWKVIDNNTKPTINDKISYTRAIEIVAQENSVPGRFVDQLVSYMDDDNINLRRHVVQTLIIRFNNLKKIEKFIISIIKQNDANKRLVLGYLFPVTNKPEKFCLKILQSCANTDDNQIIGMVAFNFAYLAPDHPIESLRILRRWCKKQGFFMGHSEYMASQMGTKNIHKISTLLLAWIRTEKNGITLQFHLPAIIREAYRDNDPELMNLILKIDYTQKKKAILIIKIVETVLSQGFHQVVRSDSFLATCNRILHKIAEHQNLEICIDRSLKNPVIQTLDLVDKVRFGQKKKNPDEIKNNLEYFPTIMQFFGRRKLHKLIENKPCHPFVQILTRSRVSKTLVKKILRRINNRKTSWEKAMMLHALQSKFFPTSLLSDMEFSLSLLGKDERGVVRLRSGLLNESDFFPTLAELNVYARFKKKYPTKLQPPVGNNELDVEVTIDGVVYLFEVFAPKNNVEVEYVRAAHTVDNKAKKRIIEKLERQIKNAAGSTHPVLLIIDKSMAHTVDYDNIIDSLYGTYQYTIEMNKQSGAIENEYSSRKSDSISDVSLYGKIISAIILLHRDMSYDDYSMILSGQLFPNPNATIPLSQTSIQKITNVLFKKITV